VDMQKDLTDPDGALAKAGEDLAAVTAAIPNAAKLLAAARKAGMMVIHIGTERSNLSESEAVVARGGALGACCRTGTPGAAFAEAVKPIAGEEIVTKYRIGGLSDTRLELLLRSNSIRTVVVAGVGASGAVDSTVREASDKDFYVVVVADGVASPGARSDLDRIALDNMAAHFARVVPAAHIAGLWAS
jgi:nicotinamidase-related amidase